MKKTLLLLTAFILISATANAQYKVNKISYNYKAYKYQMGDPYNPSVAGLTSFLIPGLGQMISGEGGRGVAFLGGAVGFGIIMGIGAAQSNTDVEEGGDGTKGAGLAFAGLLGYMAVEIWSIVDAIRVAKVNNMAWRNQSKTGFNFQVSPYIGSLHNEKVPVGLSIKVRF